MYTCNICNTRILQSSPEIQCHSCNNNHAHLRCINRFRFNHHSWNCSSCPEPPSLPFNHILHNDDFKAAVRNFFSDTNTNITKLNSLCFNPLLTDPISHQTCDHPSLINDTNIPDTECNYHTEDSFNKIKMTKDPNVFSMLHINCRSLCNANDRISNYLLQINHSFSLLACSETWLTHNISPPQRLGYNYIEGPLTGRGRGV